MASSDEEDGLQGLLEQRSELDAGIPWESLVALTGDDAELSEPSAEDGQSDDEYALVELGGSGVAEGHAPSERSSRRRKTDRKQGAADQWDAIVESASKDEFDEALQNTVLVALLDPGRGGGGAGAAAALFCR